MLAGILLFFILGLSVGSFLNVLIYRLPKNEGIFGRSYCDHCKKKLTWYDLVPIFSFVALNGKCRFCKDSIDWQIPLVEFITGLLFVFLFLKFPIVYDYNLLFYIFFVASFIVIFFTDLREGIIPDKIIFPTLFSSIVFVFITGDILNHILSGIGALLFFLVLNIITRGRGMGAGDIKLAALLGVILGFPSVFISIYLTFLTGGIVSLILILWKKKRFRKDTISFGPFLAFYAVFSLFFGKILVSLLLSFL